MTIYKYDIERLRRSLSADPELVLSFVGTARPFITICQYCGRYRHTTTTILDGTPGSCDVWERRSDVTRENHMISHGICEPCFIERFGPLEEEDQNDE